MLDWNDARRTFVQQMTREGASVKVIIVRDQACALDPSAGRDRFPITQVTASLFATGLDSL
jgi:hypothetical protein